MSRAHGCCLSAALQHVRASTSEPSDRWWWRKFARAQRCCCGDACRTSCSWTCTSFLLKCKMLPLSHCLGGLGLCSAWRSRVAAQEAATTARSLVAIMGFEPPSWRAVMAGARPPPVQPEEFEPCTTGVATRSSVSCGMAHRETQIFPRMADAAEPLVRSHGGPGGLALLTCPTCRLTTIDSHLFRVILLRHLHMPLLPTVRSCRWPSTRLFWPSPRSVRTSGGSRHSRIHSGKRSCTNLPRSGRS